ncbi:hypothetical protein G7046_g3525 [Stylonectria norvegica]|nr:hypothetical protein G7046_g3525 [Stylonectria norvegica]
MDGTHHMAVRELDLSACRHPSSMVDRVIAVPGLKTSAVRFVSSYCINTTLGHNTSKNLIAITNNEAAFFTFLRANLVLTSAMSSNTSTPQFGPYSPYTVFPSSPSPLGTNSPLVPLDDIPPLSLEILDARDDKVESLHLIADSVAQMRQRASLSMVFNPLCVAGLSAALATVYQVGYVPSSDVGLAITVSCGVVMTYLMGVRYFASGYLSIAEQMKWSWLQAEDGEEDTVLAARYNDEIIGALVLRLEPSLSPALGKKKSRSSSLKGGKGVIRAWTTRLKYRSKGIGRELLHEGVRVTKERCGKDAEVGFAKEHANSVMILPNMFNAPFRRDEVRAALALEEVLSDWEISKKKR